MNRNGKLETQCLPVLPSSLSSVSSTVTSLHFLLFLCFPLRNYPALRFAFTQADGSDEFLWFRLEMKPKSSVFLCVYYVSVYLILHVLPIAAAAVFVCQFS